MLRRCVGLLILFLLIGEGSSGQQTIKVDVDLVNIYFTVVNKRGRLISGLSCEKFDVFEDGVPQVITHFSQETDVPLRLVLLMDTSGSIRDRLTLEQQAAAAFFQATLRPERDKAAVVTFDSGVDLRQDYTDDSSLLAQAVFRIIAGGGTRLYDALALVIEEKLTDVAERKVIILLTDGKDNISANSQQDVIDVARRYAVTIYAISMNAFRNLLDDSSVSDGRLEVLAEETGGQAFFPNTLKDVIASLSRISNELRSQYTLAYRSSNRKEDGSFRSIRIQVRKGHYDVRARSGYYAPQSGSRKGN
jgi:VWFA-related protein